MLNLYSIYINTNNGIEDTAALMGLITFHAALVSIIIILVVHPHQPVSHAVKVPTILVLVVYHHALVSHVVKVPTILILVVHHH